MKIPTELLKQVRRHDGLLDRAEALKGGMTPAAIRHELRRGAWQRITTGIYATFSGTLQRQHHVRAAIMHAGPNAVVTAGYACAAYGLEYAPRDAKPIILIPHGERRAPIGIAVIRRTRHMPASRVLHGVPCAGPERAALDAAREARTLRDTRAVLCEVVQRGLTTVDRLVSEAQLLDQRRLERVRHALADVKAGCRSAPECEFRDLLAKSTVLPAVRWNMRLPDPRGEDLIPDGCIAEAQLVFEIDSMEWHQFGDAPELTERKRARYASLGWRVVPISPRRIRQQPDDVLREAEAAYLEGISDDEAA